MRLSALLVIATAACGSGGGGPDAGPVLLDPCGVGDPPAATIDVSERFDVFHTDVYARIGARLLDRPPLAFHEVALAEGECRYLRLAFGFCDPACAEGQACTVDDECSPYPAELGGGTLTITGLGDPIAVEPESFSPGTYTVPGGLPADLFGPADLVGAALEGDAFPAVTLYALGVAAIDTELTAAGFDLPADAAADLTWTSGPDPDACIQVVLNGRNQAHGAPLADVIECDSPDDGVVTIPQALAALFPPGDTPEVSEGYDWPHSELTRYTRARADLAPGPATLVVRSTTYFRLRHP